MPELAEILRDQADEGDALEAMVLPLPEADWRRLTPAEGWSIAHTIAHLAWTDEVAFEAATDPDRFRSRLSEAMAHPSGNPTSIVDEAAASGAAEPPSALLGRWQTARNRLAEALAAAPPGTKVPWFGPPMSVASMATARIMETWAHGQDVADALGVTRPPSRSLRHIAHLGIRTRDFAFRLHDRTPPGGEFRVELVAPDGEAWVWGPADADQRVRGSALDFCLLVTRRRHPADLRVEAVGAAAQEWLGIAQAFAGPPGQGRAPQGAAARA